jgi:hypothetical protein
MLHLTASVEPLQRIMTRSVCILNTTYCKSRGALCDDSAGLVRCLKSPSLLVLGTYTSRHINT